MNKITTKIQYRVSLDSVLNIGYDLVVFMLSAYSTNTPQAQA